MQLEGILRKNLESLQSRIISAAKRAARDPSEIRVVCASKYMPVGVIESLYRLGLRRFGENYVQALEERARALQSKGLDIEWHFIGRLQKNKINKLLKVGVELVHSIDSFEICKALSERALREGKRQKVLLQVNLSGEATKGGARGEDEAKRLYDSIRGLAGVEAIGIMTMAEFTEDMKKARAVFARAARLGRELGLKEFSMGMSNDFEAAIEEGATILRIGSLIYDDI